MIENDIMQPLSLDDIYTLPLKDKIDRMDNILENQNRSRIPPTAWEYFHSFKIQNVAKTKVFHNHPQQAKLIWMCFEFLLQSEYLYAYYGMMNNIVFNSTFQEYGWSSVKNQINHNALTQAIITGSRIQFEQLMNFIYFSLENRELETDFKGSKYSKFRDWIIQKGAMDDLFYLLPFLIVCRKHDDKFRTAEVHKGSKLKKHLFALSAPSMDKQSEITLHNYLLNIMKNFIPFLNYERPSSFNISFIPDIEFDLKDWIKSYNNKDEAKLCYYMKLFKKYI